MAANPLVELQKLGQSPWHDNIRRQQLTTGKLKQMIEAGDITGLTSNPTIFEQAIKSHDYDAAIEEMFEQTDVETAPWHIIPSDHKAAARVEAIRIIVDRLSAGVDTEAIPIDPKILDLAKRYLSTKLSTGESD